MLATHNKNVVILIKKEKRETQKNEYVHTACQTWFVSFVCAVCTDGLMLDPLLAINNNTYICNSGVVKQLLKNISTQFNGHY